jgi:hypothetical protein
MRDILIPLFLKEHLYLPSLTGAQQQFTVTDKYTRKKTIRWGKPCIYLNNQDPLEANLPDWQKQWLQANCVTVPSALGLPLDRRGYQPRG